MATATSSVSVSPHLGDSQAAQSDSTHDSTSCEQAHSPSFVKFDEKQATVFVNVQHIVRFEYHASTGRAHLQLSDGHHYYLSDSTALRVIDQLNGHRASSSRSAGEN